MGINGVMWTRENGGQRGRQRKQNSSKKQIIAEFQCANVYQWSRELWESQVMQTYSWKYFVEIELYEIKWECLKKNRIQWWCEKITVYKKRGVKIYEQ